VTSPASSAGSAPDLPDYTATIRSAQTGTGRAASPAFATQDRQPAQAIAATPGYTTAFTVAAAILGLGVIIAVVLLPFGRRFSEAGTAAAGPTPPAEPQPEPQAIPVALCSCSPMIDPVSGPPAAGRGSPLAKS